MQVRHVFLLMLSIVLLFGSGWCPVTMLVSPGDSAAASLADGPERLRRHVRMLSETFVPRSEAYPENLERAAGYIREQFRTSGARVTDQPFTTGSRTFRNIIASYGPEAGERIVVGAHYDAFSSYPAADDNASGVAGLLELARLLQRQSPKLRVDLVAFTLEEPPYFRTRSMGSAVYVQSLVQAKVAVRGMICLEMIGYFSDAPQSQRFPNRLFGLFYPSRANFITVVGRFSDLRLIRRVKMAMKRSCKVPVHALSAPRIIPGVDFSDHLSFWRRGYPAVMITDTAFYRNPAYHTPADTADRLDYAKMEEVVRGVCAAVQSLAVPD